MKIKEDNVHKTETQDELLGCKVFELDALLKIKNYNMSILVEKIAPSSKTKNGFVWI